MQKHWFLAYNKFTLKKLFILLYGEVLETTMIKLTKAEWAIYASGNKAIIDSDDGMLPVNWTNADLLSNRLLEKNDEIWIAISMFLS